MDNRDNGMTDCECDIGDEIRLYCTRHKCTKSRRMVELCQTRDTYFQAWEEGRGPRQNSSAPAIRPRVKMTLQKLISILTRHHRPSSHIPLEDVKTNLDFCINSCKMWNQGNLRCGELKGCSAEGMYHSKLLFGKCKHWPNGKPRIPRPQTKAAE